MRLKRLLVALVAVVVVVLGAAIGLVAVVVLTVDPDDYRADISKELERVTGRKVNLGGALELSPSLTPSIVAHDVTLSNAAWASEPNAATIGQLDVQVALVPLLDGDLHILSIRIDQASIHLETSKNGERSWVLGSTAEGSGGDAAFRLDGVTITDSTIVYLDGVTGTTRRMEIAEIDLQAADPMSPMTIAARLKLDSMPVEIDGTLDSFGSLRAGQDSQVDLTVKATNLDATAKGTLGGVSDNTPFDLAVTLDIASLGLLDTLGLVSLPIDGPLAFAGHLKGGLQQLAIEDLSLSAGGTKVTGTLTGDLTGERPSFGGSLTVDSLDIATWTGEAGDDSGESGRIFPTDLLPLHVLTLADADMTLAIGKLVAGDLTFSDVAGTVKLAAGKLAIDPLSGMIDRSKVDGTFKADATVSPASVALTLASPSLDAGALLAQTGATNAITGQADLKIDVRGTGESVAALMATLDGTAQVVMANGTVSQQGLDLFLGGATALIGGLFEKDTSTAKLTCLAAAWDIERGIATQKVLLIDTEYSTLTGEGTIDLGKETIDETLTPNAKGVTLSLAVPVRIHGSLADPAVTPDEGALAVKLGSLIGSVFFPPALLLGLGDVGLGAGHPCVAANQPGASGGGLSTGSVIDGAGKAVDEATGAVKGVVDGIGEGLDSLFGD